MTQKNIQIKIKNGSSWDELFPKTKAAIVNLGNGKTVEQCITEILNSLDTKASNAHVEERINEIVGSAPAALDTLQELATALNNNASFASTITNLLSKKVDNVTGKQLSTEDFTTALKGKLEKIKINADGTAEVTQYVHPSTHPASIITQDSNHKFCTDSEKIKWNNKSKIVVSTTAPADADIWYQEI